MEGAVERSGVVAIVIIIVMIVTVAMDMVTAWQRMRVAEIALGREIDVEVDLVRKEHVGQVHLPDDRVAVAVAPHRRMNDAVANLYFLVLVHERFGDVRIVPVLRRGTTDERRPVRNRFLLCGSGRS